MSNYREPSTLSASSQLSPHRPKLTGDQKCGLEDEQRRLPAAAMMAVLGTIPVRSVTRGGDAHCQRPFLTRWPYPHAAFRNDTVFH